jgi:ribosomal protein S6E (S10)
MIYLTRTYYAEEVQSLYDDKGKEILTGDWYHDKIGQKIDGFLLGLEFAKIKFEVEEVNTEEEYEG